MGAIMRLVGETFVMFSAEQAAAALWTYGEDDLIDSALALTERGLRELWVIAGSHWRDDHNLPLQSRLVLDKVIAFACIEYLEGTVRSLARSGVGGGRPCRTDSRIRVQCPQAR
jgi:hypothetical protein